jgi:hypothetical protein
MEEAQFKTVTIYIKNRCVSCERSTLGMGFPIFMIVFISNVIHSTSLDVNLSVNICWKELLPLAVSILQLHVLMTNVN